MKFDAFKSAWLWIMIALGAAFGVPALSRGTVAASLVLVFFTLCMGHSVGLHRGVIHVTYEAPRWLMRVLLYLFVLTGLGGPLAWAKVHAVRDYWQNRRDCPPWFAYKHSLARDFWWNLHHRYDTPSPEILARLPKGIFEDPWLRFLERTWAMHVIALGVVVAIVWGPGAAAVVVCARTAGGILGHWFVGYAAHAWGERRYRIAGATEHGTNVWLLGVLSFGEGFHNNHHAFPGSARMGERWYEFDLGYLVLRGLGTVGLVRNVQGMTASSRKAEA